MSILENWAEHGQRLFLVFGVQNTFTFNRNNRKVRSWFKLASTSKPPLDITKKISIKKNCLSAVEKEIDENPGLSTKRKYIKYNLLAISRTRSAFLR